MTSTKSVITRVLIKENLITKRLLFTIRIANSKAETQEHPTFGQYVFEQYKSIDKGNKRSSKEAKKPSCNYHLQTD
jgi:hypothetical protein